MEERIEARAAPDASGQERAETKNPPGAENAPVSGQGKDGARNPLFSDAGTLVAHKSGDGASGLKIQMMNPVFAVAAGFLLVLFLISSFQTSKSYETLRNATEHYLSAEIAANQLKRASDYLSAQARLFVVTQETEYADNYFMEARTIGRREQATHRMESEVSGSYAYIYITEAYRYSKELEKRECYAMRLVVDACGYPLTDADKELQSVTLTEAEKRMTPEEKINAAISMLHDDSYQSYAHLIDERVETCVRVLTRERERVEKENDRLLLSQTSSQRILAVFLLVIIVSIIMTVFLLVLLPLEKFVNCIRLYQPLPMIGASEMRYLASAYNSMYDKNQIASARLRHQAEHDALTGLYNRGAFDKLREERRYTPFALMLIDVDLFKRINDTYGHDIGDKVLQKVARLLDRNFRGTDFPCRIGGDEFAVIMTDVSSNMKELVRGKLQRIADALKDTSDGAPAVTLSIGAAFSDRDGGTDDIYRDADRALYVVKTHGRDGCEFFGEQYVKL